MAASYAGSAGKMVDTQFDATPAGKELATLRRMLLRWKDDPDRDNDDMHREVCGEAERALIVEIKRLQAQSAAWDAGMKGR